MTAKSSKNSGPTCQTTATSETSEESLATSSQADFLANLSAPLGSEQARQMTVRSGLKCAELLRNPSQAGCLVKMLLESSVWNSTECYLTWKPSATPHGRLLFQLVPWTQSTGEIESGLWATPTAFDHVAPKTDKAIIREMTETRKGRTNFANLRDQVARGKKMWPTFAPGTHGRGWSPLRAQVNAMNRGEKPKCQVLTVDTVMLAEMQETGRTFDEVKSQSGSLNPEWVEALMGYPPGWTEIA